MCRLLGVVSSETTDFGFSLHEAPRSLSVLSSDHPDGWGLAVHGGEGWELHKYAATARQDERFLEVVARARGELLIAHIRKRTVGSVRVENTHPFRRGRWVFAHNGTIEDAAFVERNSSAERLEEVEGDTDSERLFAYLLTHLDGAGVDRGSGSTSGPTRSAVDAALIAAVQALIERPNLGAANFLLSDGAAVYGFRFGRTLHLLTRHRGDRVRERRSSPDTNASLETPWSTRRSAYIIASERMTDEPFRELAEGTLFRVDAGEEPSISVLLGALP